MGRRRTRTGGRPGKRLTPDLAPGAPNPFEPAPPQALRSPSEVAEARRRSTARTAGRAELEARHPTLGRVSPQVGTFDDEAWAAVAREDPDAAAALLADLSHATDRAVRAAARRAALRVALRPPRSRRTTTGRPALATSADPDGADLDLDATLARLDQAPRLRGEDLRSRDWERRGSAYVVLVDTSGSVAGGRLATGVLAAGAVAAALGPGDELAVVAFARDAVVLREIGSAAAPAEALDGLLDLRGGGTTDLAFGLRTALAEAARARSGRREVLLLTDGLRTAGADATVVARECGRAGARLHVLALSDEADALAACRALAAAGGGRCALLTGPSAAPDAVTEVLGG